MPRFAPSIPPPRGLRRVVFARAAVAAVVGLAAAPALALAEETLAEETPTATVTATAAAPPAPRAAPSGPRPRPQEHQKNEETAASPAGAHPRAPASGRRQRLRRYLEREVAASHRYLDHGVLAPEVGFGAPHRYQIGLRIGLFDHLTLGASAHWLPGQATPGWTPRVGLAFYRGPHLSVGAHYARLLYPPPVADLDPATLSFQQRTHHLFGSLSLSQAWFTGGFDLGWARGLEVDPLADPEDMINQTPIERDRLAAGLFLRVGNRRFGVHGQLTYPFLSAELGVDLRFGLFERRPRAPWRLR